MGLTRKIVAAVIAAVVASSAHAADNTLLIQAEPGGKFRIWHAEGETNLPNDDVLTLEASARPEGGELLMTAAGPARAFESKEGVVIAVPGARTDKALLIDRDACGGVKVWHSEGATALTEDELTELVLTAVPGGGKRVSVGSSHARAYTTALGVMAVIWKPVTRKPAP